MNILYYMQYTGASGTFGTHVFEVLNNLSGMGHAITYVNGDMYQPVPVGDRGVPSEDAQGNSLWNKLRTGIANSPFRGEGWLLWGFFKEVLLFFPALLTVLRDRPDIIYRRHPRFNSEFLIARLFNIPSVKEVNGLGIDEIRVSQQTDRLTLWLFDKLERYVMPRADKIIVVTPALKELLQTEYKIAPEKITVIENGANTDLFKPIDSLTARKRLGLASDRKYICLVGSLQRWQGVEFAIRGMPLIMDCCPEAELLVVGGGPIKKDLEMLAESIGVKDRVIFTGMVPYYQVPLYMNAGDVCISPKNGLKSGYSSLKMREYLACEKPVVASRASGHELVEASGCGILVEQGDATAMAEAVIRLIKEPDLGRSMGRKGKVYIEENLSWRKVSEKVAGICQGLVSSGNGKGAL